MDKPLLIAGAFFGLTGVILGAFAAHGLEQLLPPEKLNAFSTGVRYQIYHAFLLLILTQIPLSNTSKKRIGILIVLGTALFSFSIYLLATNALTSVNFSKIGFLTPLGGVILIIAWAILLITFAKFKKE